LLNFGEREKNNVAIAYKGRLADRVAAKKMLRFQEDETKEYNKAAQRTAVLVFPNDRRSNTVFIPPIISVPSAMWRQIISGWETLWSLSGNDCMISFSTL
jgi:hypothetical protein